MKRTFKELCIRVLVLLFGLTVAHLGVTLFLLADLGADPFNVLVQGIFRSLDRIIDWKLLTHGNTHMAVCFLIILILLLADRSYIKIGTILCMAFGGPIIDFFSGLLSFLFEKGNPFWLNLAILALGCVILALGMTIVIKSDAGVGPNDLVALVISDKMHRRFGVIRILVDVSFVAVGFLLGGTIGIGTVICAFLVGPVADFFLPRSGKFVTAVLKLTRAA